MDGSGASSTDCVCAERYAARRVRMPSFFAYMLYSGAILLPVFAAVTWLFFKD